MYKKFEKLLEKTHKTTYRVSKETGIAQNVFSNWKSGRSVPKTDKLKILADYFGVSIEYFLEQEVGEMNLTDASLILGILSIILGIATIIERWRH